MDKIKGMVGDAGGLKDKLDDINFPVQKNQLVSQLQQKGGAQPGHRSAQQG